MKTIPKSVNDANKTWKAISQPNRWAILAMLEKSPGLKAKVIQRRLKMHQSTVSAYMKKLEGEGIIEATGKLGAWRTDPLRYTLKQPRWNNIKNAIEWLNRE